MPIKIDGRTARVLKENTKLAHHIDKAIEKGEFEYEFRIAPKISDTAWHPSSDCTPSVHELWEKATGKKKREKLSAASLKTFQVGHWWHNYLQFVVVERLGFATWDAIERRQTRGWPLPKTSHPYHWVQGIADVAPCMIDNEPYVVDFKTQKSFDYKLSAMPDWCAFKYTCQINIYMDLFDIDKGLIVAINKDTPHDLKEWRFTRNQPLIDAIYKKWHLVSRYLDRGQEPDPDEDVVLPAAGPDV